MQNPKEIKKKSPTIGLRCSPGEISDAAELLEGDTKDVLRDCGFGDLLDMRVKRCFSIERILFMITKCDVSSKDESFTIVFSEENKIKVTPEKVKHAFGIPDGTHKDPATNDKDPAMNDKDPAMNSGNWNKKWEEFWKKLKSEGYNVERLDVIANGKTVLRKKISVKVLKQYIKDVKDDKDEQARAFLYIVLFKLLLPSTSNYLLSQHVGMCSDFNWVKNFNWCKYVCQDLKNRIAAHQKDMRRSKIDGCMFLLMVSDDL